MLNNKVSLIGHVGKDPEVKHLESGSCVATFSLATNESYKDKAGKKVEHSEWHSLVVWGEQAKIVEKYVKKGHKLAIEGKLRTRNYEKDGQKHYVTEIFVNELMFLEKPVASNAPANSSTANYPPPSNPLTDINQGSGPQVDELSDLPF